jgi:methyltransferase-like protein/SAM-dependent methyltransferase
MNVAAPPEEVGVKESPMSTPSLTPYDELVYPTYSFPQTHPDLLCTLAGLFGVRAAPADQCRVLELGCGTGGNLIPLAVAWPDSRFVGVDYAARHVEVAQHCIEQLGLGNIDIRHASILDVSEGDGLFDYVICHGVYSWVPEEVQNGILRVCRRNLKPDGVAYISYNTLPGWHMRGMIREMMCYHDAAQRGRTPLERVAQARGLLRFLSNANRGRQSSYAMLLQQELEQLQKLPDSYIYHEHLEEHNDPLYFFEFNERLTAHGLRFLGEADFCAMVHENLPEDVRGQLAAVAPNLIRMEQYLDFLSNRTFRQSLICHEHHRPDYTLTPDRLAGLRVATSLRPVAAAADLKPGVSEAFTSPGGAKVNATEPILKAALLFLAEVWPMAVPVEEVFRQALRRLDRVHGTDEQSRRDRDELDGSLLRIYSVAGQGTLELWSCYPSFATRPGERPAASPVVRLMARDGDRVTNLRHQTITVGAFDRHILPLLDGTLTRAALRNRMLDAFRQGQVQLARNGQPIRDEHQARALLADTIEQQLRKYAETALLIRT